MQVEDLVNSTANLDDDSTRFAEMILAKARFHRILVESLERGVNNDQKVEKKPKEKSKKKKRRKSKKDKDKKEKHKVKKEREEQKIEEMLEKIRLKKEKLKLRKERENEKEKEKKKKKKSKKKKKKRDSKAKTVTIEVSDHDSDDEGFNCWWSIGIEQENDDEGDKSKAKKTQIVNKTPRKKCSKRSRKKCIDKTDHSFTDQSQSTADQSTADQSTSVTEHTARSSLASSHQWSFSSPMVRKVSEDLSEHAVNTATVMWWDNVKDTVPYMPTSLSTKTPTTTPTAAPKRSAIPMLLSPRSDSSDSEDYDDVSIFSEESLSEQILDDLSCILDCSDESDNDDEENPTSKKSLRNLSNKSYDSSSICSGPFIPMSPLRKNTSFTESPCMTPTSERHLSSVKIISSRSLLTNSEEGTTSPRAKSASSPGEPSDANSSVRDESSPLGPQSPSQTGSRTEPTRNSPLATIEQSENNDKKNEVPQSPHLDGIQPVPREGLFGNREITTSPKKGLGSPSLDGIQPVSRVGLFGKRKTPGSPCLPDNVPLA